MAATTLTNLTRATEIGANSYCLEIAGRRIILDSGLHPRFEGEAALPQLSLLEPESVAIYRTVGEPTGEPVLILHGTAGTGAGMLNPAFAGELFGEGQPLDAKKYFIILPDALGAGKSTKPSDGLRMRFPKYNYDDMVQAQYRLVTEHLGVKHLRAIVGNSMGGMHAWTWGVKYPDAMDALVPMACQPTEMSSRNWMMRRLLTESIRRLGGCSV